MAIKDKLISNTTYLALNWASNTLFFMLFWIILFKVLSPAFTGKVALALQISTLLSSLSLFGLGLTTQKLISEMKENKQTNKIQNLISFSLKATFIASLIFSAGFIIFSMQIPNFLELDSSALWLVVISIISMTLGTILAGVYFGFQNMKKIFLTTLYGDVSLVLLTLLFLYLGLDYLSAILAFALSHIVMFLTRIKMNMLKTSKKDHIDKGMILKYSVPAFVVVFFSVVLNNSQYIILSSLQTIEITGIYAVGTKIISVLAVIPTIFGNALFPITSGLSADKNSKSKQSYLISLVFRYTIFIVFPLALFMIVFSKYLILFFSSPEYLVAATFLPFLVGGAVAFGLATQFLSSLYAIGKPKKYRDSYIISTLIYLFSAIILAYYFSASGLAISYLLSSTVLLIITFLSIRKYLIIKLPTKTLAKVMIGIIVSFLFLFFMKPLIHNLWVAGGFVVIASIIYFTVLLKIGFYVEEDLKALEFIVERTPLFKKQITYFKNYLSKFVTRSHIEEL